MVTTTPMMMTMMIVVIMMVLMTLMSHAAAPFLCALGGHDSLPCSDRAVNSPATCSRGWAASLRCSSSRQRSAPPWPPA